MSFTLDDSPAARLRSGEPLADAVAAVTAAASSSRLAAVLLNCSHPEAISAALPLLLSLVPPGVKVGAYANGFKTTTTQWLGQRSGDLTIRDEDYLPSGMITPAACARYALSWRRQGATILGGCCGVGPEHIAAVAGVVRHWEQQQQAADDAALQ